MNIQIKPAVKNDWKVIQKFNDQVFINNQEHDDDLDTNWPFSQKGVGYYKNLANGKYGKCFIAYLDNKPAGYVALATKDFGYRKSKYVEIENIGVDPDYRSQGIGKKLIKEAEKWAREQNATKLFVSAYWGNKRAIGFYKKIGFYESGIEMDKKL